MEACENELILTPQVCLKKNTSPVCYLESEDIQDSYKLEEPKAKKP